MKRLFLAFVTVLISSSLFSQGFRNMEPEEMAKRDTEQLVERAIDTGTIHKAVYHLLVYVCWMLFVHVWGYFIIITMCIH